jgi:hypothetical protein
MIYCIGSRCRRVAVLNRKVSINRTTWIAVTTMNVYGFTWDQPVSLVDLHA